MNALERERFVRIRGRARGPSGPDDQDWMVVRAVEGDVLRGTSQHLVIVRAWIPPWSGDSWPEYHRQRDLEPSPADPRSAAEVEALPAGELAALLRRLAERLPAGAQAELSASDLDLLHELPQHWEAHGTFPSAAALRSAEKVAAHVVELAEGARRDLPPPRTTASREADLELCRRTVRALCPKVALAELQAAREEAEAARRAWVDDLRAARAFGRRPSSDVRRRRTVARARARICDRLYLRSLEGEED